MSEDGMYMFLTYGKFLGIGYIRDNQGWHILVLFSSLKEANQLWDAEFKQLDEKSITISFVEHKTDYKFMVYSMPLKKMPSNNFSLYRSLDLSQYYKTFKKGYDGKVRLGFAVLAEPQPVVLGYFKTVTNVKFIPESKIESNSPEWIAKEVQERAKQDARKSDDYLT